MQWFETSFLHWCQSVLGLKTGFVFKIIVLFYTKVYDFDFSKRQIGPVFLLKWLVISDAFNDDDDDDDDDGDNVMQLRSMQLMLAEMQQKAAAAAAADVSSGLQSPSELGSPPASKPPPPPVAARQRSVEGQFICFCCCLVWP